MKSPPSLPKLAMEEALELIAPIKRSTGYPCEYSLPNFHSNVYVRLLAAKPKMDTITRRVYPSSLLTRIGITQDRKLDSMTSIGTFSGPRLWVSSSPNISKLPKEARGKLASKTPAIARLQNEPDYGARRILLEDLKLSLDLYMRDPPAEDKPVVCCTRPNVESKALLLDISKFPELIALNIPEIIRSGRYGLYTAGSIVKYLFINSSQNMTGKWSSK